MRRLGIFGTLLGTLMACQPGDAEPGVGTSEATTALVVPAARQARLPATRITVDATRTLHAASPFVNGYNRNHSHRQFAVHRFDRPGFLQALGRLSPRWGTAYLRELQQAGYPARLDRRALYRTGHAPTDGRTDYSYLGGYRFLECWGRDGQDGTWDGYPYDDMRYPLAEADAAGAETLVTVNFGTDTPESAGSLAGWLNATSAPLRTAQPFFGPPGREGTPRGTFLFEIGNEVQLRVERGHERARSVPMYVREARPYVEALRSGSPHPIKIALAAAVNTFWGGPSYPLTGEGWAQQEAMVEAFVAAARQEGFRFDALQFHGYPSYPVTEALAGNAYVERLITTRLQPALERAPFPIEIWNDEFHAASGLPRNTGMYGALYAADAAATALRLSSRGRQLIPVTTDFAAWHAGRGGASDSLYFPGNQLERPSPLYLFRRLLAEHWGDWVVASEVTGGPAWTDVARNGESTPVSSLNAVAARDEAGALHLLVVNRSRLDCEATVVTPTGADLGAGARRWVLAPRNGPEDPYDASWEQVALTEETLPARGGALRFPAASITFLTTAAR